MTGGCTAGTNPIKQSKQGATHFIMQVTPVTKNPAQVHLRAILGRFPRNLQKSRTSIERRAGFMGHSPETSQNILQIGLHPVAPDPIPRLICAKADATFACL